MTEYDKFAELYERHFAQDFKQRVLPVLQKLLLHSLAPAAHILELCCGPGSITQALAERGYRLTGVDLSGPMLQLARRNVPEATFLHEDVRCFRTSGTFDAALCFFNSFAHMLSPEDLTSAFQQVNAALKPHGTFLFDISMEEAYRTKWRGSFSRIEPDAVWICCPSYDSAQRMATNRITLFEPSNSALWSRNDFEIRQRCHSHQQILSALKNSGFGQIEVFDAERDLDMSGEAGRSFFYAVNR
ncbi:MAG TPA: class I SAM-dependent methyltransferase [Terriglobales bacterium]|nr:class I SAM-dependent methyltransferase [Terriglobales bacterium]